MLLTVSLILAGCGGVVTSGGDVTQEEPGRSAPARVEGGGCNVMTGEPGLGEGVYQYIQGGDELVCVSQEGGELGYSEPAPMNEEWVDDPLLNAQINDMAEHQGRDVAVAYTEYYECNRALGPVPVPPPWADALIDSMRDDDGEHTYDQAVDAVDASVDAYNKRIDDAEDCDRAYAEATGEVPYDFWMDDESQFGTVVVGGFADPGR